MQQLPLTIPIIFLLALPAIAQEFLTPDSSIPPTVEDVIGSNLVGDQAQVRDRIDQWIDAGVHHLVIQPMPPMECMRFFGEKIIHHYS